MENYKIEVWFRYVIAGDQEKDCEIHDIQANNLQEAVNKASELYINRMSIPFEYLHNGEKQNPTILTKDDIYNLTAPIL